MTPSSATDSCTRTWSCWWAGKTSMMRSMVCGALCVWSVAKTRWPVSAAVSAVEIVSRSRISPTRITSGSWRRAPFSAAANVCASEPISRWLTMHFLCEWRNSIGSSTVMMCSSRDSLIASIMAASEVDLPEPVGPVTRTRPRLLGEVVDGRRQPEVVDGDDVGRDQAEGGADGRALEVGVDAKARVAGHRVGEVDLPLGLELLALVVGEDRVDDLARVGRRQARIALHPHEASADADHRRGAGGDVQVGGAARHDVHEEIGEVEVHRPADRTFGHAP